MNPYQMMHIATRNVQRRKKNSIGIIATTTGTVMMLVVMLGVQLGSHESLKSIYTGLLQADYQLHTKDYTGLDDTDHFSSVIHNPKRIIEALSKDKRLITTARGIQFALISANDKNYAIQILGVEPAMEKEMSMPLKTLIQGDGILEGNKNQMVIGKQLALFLNIGVGDTLTILAMDAYDSMVVEQFHITGIFATGEKNIDKMISMINLKDFQNIFFNGQNVAHTIVSKALKSNESSAIQSIEETIAKENNLTLWRYSDLDPTITDMFIFQNTISGIYYVCFVLLIVLSLLNSFTMMIMNRISEFGLLFALGLKPEDLKWIVCIEIFICNTIGVALGIGLGYVWLYYLSKAGFGLPVILVKTAPIMFPKQVYPNLTNIGILMGPMVVYVCNFFIIIPPLRKLKAMNVIKAITSE